MRPYEELINHILINGKERGDRTGTGTVSVFGTKSEYHMFDGFPLLGKRSVSLKWIQGELEWLLAGEGNIRKLKEKGITIWDEWALKREDVMVDSNICSLRLLLAANDKGLRRPVGTPFEIEKWCKENNIDFEKILNCVEGDLGPIYPVQWRNFEGVDQIKKTLHTCKEHPFSRRHYVSAWNPQHLPDENLTPEQNVLNGKMALAPCHHGFQFYVEELSLNERLMHALIMIRKWDLVQVAHGTGNQRNIALGALGIFHTQDECEIQAILDERNVPTKGISIEFIMRSSDVVLGTPYNVASYAMLLMMYARILGYAPLRVIHQCGDAHIYLNHLEQIDEMMQRDTPALPQLYWAEDTPNDIDDPADYRWEHFELVGYKPGPRMDFPIAK